MRVDAHSELPPGYTARMVDALRRTGAASVGGVMFARGTTPFQAPSRAPTTAGSASAAAPTTRAPSRDRASLPTWACFAGSLVEHLGWYDESLRRGEDYELSQRILAAGRLIWFLPDVRVELPPPHDLAVPWRGRCTRPGVWRGELVRRAR